MVTFLDHCNHDKKWTTIYMDVTKTAPRMLEAGYIMGFKWGKTNTVLKQCFLKGLSVLLLSITIFLKHYIQKSKYGGVPERNLLTNSTYHLNKHMNGKIPTPTGRLVGSDLLARRSGGSEATEV